MTTLDQLKDSLQQAGFKIASDSCQMKENNCKWYAYRRSQLPARECETNEGKGAQLVVQPYVIDTASYGEHTSVEVTLTGEYANWWKLTAYSLTFDNLITELPAVEARLVAAWNALSTVGG